MQNVRVDTEQEDEIPPCSNKSKSVNIFKTPYQIANTLHNSIRTKTDDASI